MRRSKAGIPTTNRIHNEMDDPIPNRPKKCSYCRNEGHNRTNCHYKQLYLNVTYVFSLMKNDASNF